MRILRHLLRLPFIIPSFPNGIVKKVSKTVLILSILFITRDEWEENAYFQAAIILNTCKANAGTRSNKRLHRKRLPCAICSLLTVGMHERWESSKLPCISHRVRLNINIYQIAAGTVSCSSVTEAAAICSQVRSHICPVLQMIQRNDFHFWVRKRVAAWMILDRLCSSKVRSWYCGAFDRTRQKSGWILEEK